MRLPRTTAVLPETVPAQPCLVGPAGSESPALDRAVESREVGIQPQGCCGIQVCLPFVGCHCVGFESPLC